MKDKNFADKCFGEVFGVQEDSLFAYSHLASIFSYLRGIFYAENNETGKLSRSKK